VNAGAWRDAVPVDRATAEVVREAVRWAELTDGRFDPGLARLMDLWDVGRRQVPLAEQAFVRMASRRFYRAIEVGSFREHAVIRLDQRDAGIDLGGIAKGFAVDRAIATLRAAGIRNAVVNAGGDLYAMGRSERGNRWRVGIRSAADPSRIEGQLELEDEAVATSGDYFQGFNYKGRRYHHIMDPSRAEPRLTSTHSVTVRAPNCLTADAGATAVFGLENAAARKLLSNLVAGADLVSRS
jgi:thiamine biosynthesis lipoprotein